MRKGGPKKGVLDLNRQARDLMILIIGPKRDTLVIKETTSTLEIAVKIGQEDLRLKGIDAIVVPDLLPEVATIDVTTTVKDIEIHFNPRKPNILFVRTLQNLKLKSKNCQFKLFTRLNFQN